MRRGNLTRSPADSYGFVRPLGNWPAYCASAPRGTVNSHPCGSPAWVGTCRHRRGAGGAGAPMLLAGVLVNGCRISELLSQSSAATGPPVVADGLRAD